MPDLGASWEHRFEVRGGLGLVVARELAAVVVGGWVEKEEVGEGSFIFSFAERSSCVEIRARLRHPQSPPERFRGLTPLYNLMAGLLEAGCQVRAEGVWAEKLPKGQATPRTLALRPIFQHNLPPEERHPELSLARVEEAVRDLPGRVDYTHEGDRVFRHANGIAMQVLTSKAHRIAWSEPPSCRLMTDYFDQGPRPVSSWGELWMGYWVNLGRGLPAALHLFPEEVGLVSDVYVHRYRVADRSTLQNFSELNFGQGPPLLYSPDNWLGFARQCGDRGDYVMALRCCELARKCGRSEAADRIAVAEAHWRDWQAYISQIQEAGPEISIRSLADLIDVVGFADRLRLISEEIAWEIYDAESYRRPTRLLDHLLDYPVRTGRELLAAGVTPRVMKWLGLGEGGIAPPERYQTIFQLRCGEWTLWGTVISGYMFIREEPLVLYKMSMP